MSQSKRNPATTPAADPPVADSASNPPLAVCLRCGAPGPVGDDGFCDKCEKALEQACL